MTTHIKSFINSTQPLEESSFEASSRPLNFESLLEGPKKFSEIVKEYTEDELLRAKQRGYIEGYTDAMTCADNPALTKVNKIREATEKEVKEYIQKVVFLVSLVRNFANKELPNLIIEQCRVKLSFESNWIRVFFVLNSSTEDEISFSNLLNFVEIHFTDKETVHIELMFVNQKERDIDYSSIKSDYPFRIQPIELTPTP